MKLLIVDDETLTRKGLIEAIDWDALGIDEILQADDGLNALKIAQEQHPDILLCDIRMPRLSGIDLVEALREQSPHTSVIFMSGYSDKEYLKAAIKFQALNYIEKPLDPAEVTAAVVEALHQQQEYRRTRQTQDLDRQQKATQFARYLTHPFNENAEAITALAEELAQPEHDHFFTYIIKTDARYLTTENFELGLSAFAHFLAARKLHCYFVSLHTAYQVLILTAKKAPSRLLFGEIEQYIRENIKDLGTYYLGRGQVVSGLTRAYDSYTSAVIALQPSFFYPTGRLFTPPERDILLQKPYSQVPFESTAEFAELLLEKDRPRAETALATLQHFYQENPQALPSQAKDLYYRLLGSLDEVKRRLGLSIAPSDTGDNRLDSIENCFTFAELHTLLTEGVAHFFRALEVHTPEDTTVYLIKEYIAKNYPEENLSIKDISEYAHLSVSYMCTYFKNQTGQTLNQYLTEYRMEKAIQLLADPRNQIADIAAKTGYSNSNYFSKSFKKYTGISPSKYRENKAL